MGSYHDDVEELFEVEHVLASRVGMYYTEYLVQWVGYDELTWEESPRLESAQESIRAFNALVEQEEALLLEAHRLSEREVIVID
jgi:hypothetical protein